MATNPILNILYLLTSLNKHKYKIFTFSSGVIMIIDPTTQNNKHKYKTTIGSRKQLLHTILKIFKQKLNHLYMKHTRKHMLVYFVEVTFLIMI